ncbi:hypothetical protein Goshw_012868 [Gossypium schwendimanii]|uniref:protein-serine/threonine phosphatase n=3 Tax=Gossypium TaxID=3633 RepID=A0A7J9NC09_GOSSC|nr:hypothetical protein [Gossypium schwendimanii]
MSSKGEHQTVPLSVLLKRESESEKIENPEILHGQASQSKKGEDFTLLKTECQRAMGDGVATFSVFGLFDGHNGSAAAIYTKENLLNNVLSAIPADLNRDEWVAALPRALVAGFVKTDKDFQAKAKTSGTTVTFVIIDGWVVTVASVGDSRCIFESGEGGIYYLSADHRLECNEEERERITSSGGEVGRLNTGGGTQIGPLRCWPGGLCLSRSIGDMDVGEYIVPVPYVKQVKLSTAGGRLIISSDGVWDVLSAEVALDCCRGMSPDAAAAQIVKMSMQVQPTHTSSLPGSTIPTFFSFWPIRYAFLALRYVSDRCLSSLLLTPWSDKQEAVHAKGLRDDTTCIVVDILPLEKPSASLPPPKKAVKGKLKAMFRKKHSEASSQSDKEYMEPDVVEELFEEGSAMLSERFATKYPLCNMFKLFTCAVCQLEMKPGEGISIHAGTSNSVKLRPWDGPFLCSTCQEKKEAMEGKRPSGSNNKALLYLLPPLQIYGTKRSLNILFLFYLFSGRHGSDSD